MAYGCSVLSKAGWTEAGLNLEATSQPFGQEPWVPRGTVVTSSCSSQQDPLDVGMGSLRPTLSERDGGLGSHKRKTNVEIIRE